MKNKSKKDLEQELAELKKELEILRTQLKIAKTYPKDHRDTQERTKSDDTNLNIQKDGLQNQSQTQNTEKKQNNEHQGNENNNQQTKPINIEKPPIINIMGSSQQITYKLIKETLSIPNFKIKRINNNRHYVQLESLKNYNLVIDNLKQRKVKFFTFTPKNLKSQTILLKEIDSSFNPDEVGQEIGKLKLDNINVIKVANYFANQKNKEANKPSVFLVQLSPDSNINNLTKIKFLLNQVVSWKRLKKKTQLFAYIAKEQDIRKITAIWTSVALNVIKATNQVIA